MIRHGILVCDNCRKILAGGNITRLEDSPGVETLESAYDHASHGNALYEGAGQEPTREGVHVCKERCKRGKHYNRSKKARGLMHKHYYGPKE